MARDRSLPSERRVRAIEHLTLASVLDTRIGETLPELRDDPDPAVVQAVERSLSPGGPSDALARVLASRHPSSRVRRLVFDELVFAEEWTATVVSAFRVALEDPELREEAREQLLEFGCLAEAPTDCRALTPFLVELYAEQAPEQREALLCMNGLAHPELLARGLADPHPAIRRAALDEVTLGPTRPDLTPLVLAALNDPDPTVREAALFAVEDLDLAPAEALPALLDLARSDSDDPGTLEGFTLDEQADMVASQFVEDAAKDGAPPWRALIQAWRVELLCWLGGVLAWLAIVRRVPRRLPVGRRRALQCAVAVAVPVAATFAGCAWIAADLREVAEVELFLPRPENLWVSPWLALQLTAAGLVTLGAVWALQRRDRSPTP